MDNDRRFSIFLCQIRSDLSMGAFDLMIDGLSDVMKKTRPLGLFHIDS